MVGLGNAEWIDGENDNSNRKKTKVLLFWKSPSEWAERLYKHVCDTGQTGSIVTVYELFMSDESKGQDFHGLPEPMWRRIIAVLEEQGRAKLFAAEGSEALGSEAGVKFF